MKRYKFLTLITVLVISLQAQTKSDIFAKRNFPITWLGVDFTRAIYIGDPGTVSAEEMKELFNRINMLVIYEPSKYNIAKSFGKDSVNNNIAVTIENNKAINPANIMSLNTKDYMKLDESAVKNCVSAYNFDSSYSGVGLVFIMDGLNKIEEEAAMWVTFVNIQTKEVIYTEKITGKAFGFGFRNHWAGSIHDVIKKVDQSYYNTWKKRYGSSK